MPGAMPSLSYSGGSAQSAAENNSRTVLNGGSSGIGEIGSFLQALGGGNSANGAPRSDYVNTLLSLEGVGSTGTDLRFETPANVPWLWIGVGAIAVFLFIKKVV